jgi:uracil DNA glycosylase
MYQELSTDIEGFIRPNHGCLTGWAEQGMELYFDQFFFLLDLVFKGC